MNTIITLDKLPFSKLRKRTFNKGFMDSFQQVKYRQSDWPAVTNFRAIDFQPHHQELVMKLSKVDLTEMVHGHPAQTVLQMTIYK